MIDLCVSNPCQNGYTCTGIRNDYECSCLYEENSVWSGKNCDVDLFCTSTTCNGNGACSNGACACDADSTSAWIGEECDFQDFCKISQNGAVVDRRTCPPNSDCFNNQNNDGHECICHSGFSPEGDCSISNCDNYCKNSGSCSMDTNGVPACSCINGYSGSTCANPPITEDYTVTFTYNGVSVISAISPYAFQLNQYTDNTYFQKSNAFSYNVNSVIYLQIDSVTSAENSAVADFPSRTYEYAVSKCFFEDNYGNFDYTLIEPAQSQCDNSYLGTVFGYQNEKAQVSHKLLLKGFSSSSSYVLKCDIKVCDKTDINSVCKSLKSNC